MALPVYIQTFEKGLLADKIKVLEERLKSCDLCPRKCKVNRLKGKTGICKTAANAIVSSYSPHFGEEAPLVGRSGSGTIFFTHCNLLCNFCQNYEISHSGYGTPVEPARLVQMMISLQKQGCHNINLVTPSHVVPQILRAVELAIQRGLRLPLVYNSSAYDDVDTLKTLEGVIDIYMPDFKFWDSKISCETCNAPDYPEIAKIAIKEMYRQVGDLQMDSRGIAVRGLLVRHLVMPNGVAGTAEIMRFLAQEISPNTYVNIMSQYHPNGLAFSNPLLSRRITVNEFQKALASAFEEGLGRLDKPVESVFFKTVPLSN